MNNTIVRLTHTYSQVPSNVFIETNIDIQELKKIMHLWQLKLAYKEETMDFSEDEMADILLSFGCKKVDNPTKYEEIDLYMLWEYGVQTRNPMVTKEDLESPKYVNDVALRIMDEVIRRTNEYYDEQKSLKNG